MSSFQIILAVCIFLYAWARAPHLLRVDREMVIKYGLLMAAINLLKAIFLFTYLQHYQPAVFWQATQIFNFIPVNYLLAVWWEDAFYILPYLLLAPLILSVQTRWIKFCALTLAAFAFGATAYHFMLGHLYQGPMGMVTIIYPFLAYAVASWKGLGTVMMLHIIFDFTMYAGVWALLRLSGL